MIYVIDSSDIYRNYDNAEQKYAQCQGPEFYAALNESRMKELDVPLLIFANKFDLPDSEPIFKILEQLEAHKIEKNGLSNYVLLKQKKDYGNE